MTSGGAEEDARLEELLSAAAREQDAVLGAARTLTDAPGAERVATLVHGLDARRRTWRRLAVVLAAAALAALFFALRASSPVPEDAPDAILGGAAVSLRAPLGAGARFETFTWDASAAAVGFEVLVSPEPAEGSPAEGGGRPLARSARVRVRSWSPSPEEVPSWPDRIRWEVRAFDASGALLGAASASAWR